MIENIIFLLNWLFYYSFYFLATPTLAILVNNKIVNENDLIEFKYGQIYSLTCTAIDSRPEVSLSLFDTDSLNELTINDPKNFISNSSCDLSTTKLCTSILQVSFYLDQLNNRFDQMKSLTCLTSSKNNDVQMSIRQSRNVSVILQTTTTTSTSTLISTSTG